MKGTIRQVSREVKELKRHLVVREPSHFSVRHLISALFGSLLVALAFVFKELLFEVSQRLSTGHLWGIVIATVILLSTEIYFIGYARVTNKPERKFFQFWFKRLLAYYSIGIFVSALLVQLYGLSTFVGIGAFKIVIAVSLPASIGAAAADLLNKY